VIGVKHGAEGSDDASAVHCGLFVWYAVSLQGRQRPSGEAVTVHPLSHRGARDEQTQHVTAAASVTAHGARVPLYDGATGERRQNDTLTGSARTLYVDEHGQVIQGEFEHGLFVWYEVSLQGQRGHPAP
jgi:hypothetical protein